MTDSSGSTLSAESRTAQRDDAMRESTKGLLWINGGGAAVLLAFLQAVIDARPVLATFVVLGIASMLIGLACGARVQFYRFRASQAAQFHPDLHQQFYERYVGLSTASIVGFIVGSALVIVGALIAIWCTS